MKNDTFPLGNVLGVGIVVMLLAFAIRRAWLAGAVTLDHLYRGGHP